ncbi:MAG: (2Fe-2S)-binding protein [Gammaproteobacteria bacterium]|nr:(2Fe-2S)-binding protein [Gammaproteobacteria bacterium]
MSKRFVRLGETRRPEVQLYIDGEPAVALQGDTLLVALLQHSNRLRTSEFGDAERAGFCLMGACQDCWVRTEEGARMRACSTTVAENMRIVTTPLEISWPQQQ